MKYSNLESDINKLAQQFGLGGKFRESINLGGRWLELTNSDFKSMMTDLRRVDDDIRKLVTGDGTSHESLKQILKITQSKINKKDYVAALAEIIKFYDIVCSAGDKLKELDPDFLKSHYEILSSGLSGEQLDSLFSLKSKFANDQQNQLVKSAGILDFLYGIFSSRGRSLSSWSKRFPRSAKKLQRSINALYRSSVAMNNSIVSSLKKMKEYRINRKVEDYLEEKKRVLSKIDNYQSQFKSLYDSEVKEILKI